MNKMDSLGRNQRVHYFKSRKPFKSSSGAGAIENQYWGTEFLLGPRADEAIISMLHNYSRGAADESIMPTHPQLMAFNDTTCDSLSIIRFWPKLGREQTPHQLFDILGYLIMQGKCNLVDRIYFWRSLKSDISSLFKS